MLLKPYVALDIETTGLDPSQDQILEIGAVFDNGVDNIQNLPSFRVISNDIRITGNAYALSMHATLLKEISENRGVANPVDSLCKWLTELFSNTALAHQAVTLAGKNVANFDLLFLLNNNFNYPYNHRIIDVGNIYFTDFGYVPSLQDINTLINHKPVSHTALDDAFNVVTAIRYKLGRS